MRTRLIILAGAVAALIVGLYALLDSRVFKREIDPGLQSHFITDKNNWWKELPVEVIPARTGIYNLETQGKEKDE
jgi:hypothetical protein